MRFSTVSKLSLAALGFGHNALACVKFSAIYDVLSDGNLGVILEDNGSVQCIWGPAYFGFLSNGHTGVTLDCNPGYSGSFDLGSGQVEFSYGSFSGSFGTTTQCLEGNCAQIQYTASVWGC